MENKKQKKELKDSRLIMRMTSREDDKLGCLSNYLCKSRSDVMRDALDMLYQSEGGDEIRNKPPKECNVHISLSDREINLLNETAKNSGDSTSDIVRKALSLYAKIQKDF